MELASHLAEASLQTLPKEEQNLRTIAVWETLRCLASKCLCAAVRQAAKAKLSLILWTRPVRSKQEMESEIESGSEVWKR